MNVNNHGWFLTWQPIGVVELSVFSWCEEGRGEQDWTQPALLQEETA